MEKPILDPPNTDFDAHDHAMATPIRRVVAELVELLGATTVAAIGGVTETRAVAQWMVDRDPQRPHVLRFTLQIASMIAARADHEIMRAWFHGSNPRLDDRSPIQLLRNEPLHEIQGALLSASRAFARRA